VKTGRTLRRKNEYSNNAYHFNSTMKTMRSSEILSYHLKNMEMKTVIILKAMLENAKSIDQVQRVKAICRLNNVKFDKLSLDDCTFRRAVEFKQTEHFLIKGA
jgi:hypothetical protein